MIKRKDLLLHALFLFVGMPGFILHSGFNDEYYWSAAMSVTWIPCMIAFIMFYVRKINQRRVSLCYYPCYTMGVVYGLLNGFFY